MGFQLGGEQKLLRLLDASIPTPLGEIKRNGKPLAQETLRQKGIEFTMPPVVYRTDPFRFSF